MKIVTEIDAVQWLGEGHPLPDGAFLCWPEVHFSSGRQYVYFTFADLRAHHWIDFEQRPMPHPDKLDNGGLSSGIRVELQDGTKYWREVLPFTFWSIKSEANANGDHRAVYLDQSDDAQLRAFLDYADLEEWGELKDGVRRLPPRAEYRVTDGAYGRGFRPVYLKPGDWLLLDKDFKKIRAVSDEELKAMRA